MNCKEARQLIDGYVDGELDLIHSVELEGHLADCSACLQTVEARKALSKTVRTASLRFDAPQGLEKRVLARVRQERVTEKESASPVWRPGFPALRLALGAAAIALLVFVAAFLGWNGVRLRSDAVAQDRAVQEVIASHVRSLQANHLFDVASTDQHTVKPWFNGRLDYAPPVVDLTKEGFPLTGGRLDYLDGRPVSALVYRRRLHVINLFVWPARAGESEPLPQVTETSYRGYHTLHWTRGGMTFYAVSDVNAGDLKEFARDLQESMGP